MLPSAGDIISCWFLIDDLVICVNAVWFNHDSDLIDLICCFKWSLDIAHSFSTSVKSCKLLKEQGEPVNSDICKHCLLFATNFVKSYNFSVLLLNWKLHIIKNMKYHV